MTQVDLLSCWLKSFSLCVRSSLQPPTRSQNCIQHKYDRTKEELRIERERERNSPNSIVHHIDVVFGRTPSGSEFSVVHPPNAFGTMANFLAPKLPTALTGAVIGETPSSLVVQQSKQLKRERHAIRPPVKHEWSLPGGGHELKKPYIFQHELLQNFSIHLFCKVITT